MDPSKLIGRFFELLVQVETHMYSWYSRAEVVGVGDNGFVVRYCAGVPQWKEGERPKPVWKTDAIVIDKVRKIREII